MADIETSLTINASVSDVYGAITEYEDKSFIKEWRPHLLSVGVTAGKPLRTGSMIALTKQFLGTDIFVNADVVDMQRNKRFELKGMHGRFPYNRTIEVTPNGRQTLITDRVNIQSNFFWFWWKPFVIRGMRSQIQTEWQTLKGMLEK